MVELEECKLITGLYCKLDNPEFVGQTRLMEDGFYYMVWRVMKNYIKPKTNYNMKAIVRYRWAMFSIICLITLEAINIWSCL
jgi:hypothetical protein